MKPWKPILSVVVILSAILAVCQTGLSQEDSDTKPLVLRGATIIDGSGRIQHRDSVLGG